MVWLQKSLALRPMYEPLFPGGGLVAPATKLLLLLLSRPITPPPALAAGTGAGCNGAGVGAVLFQNAALLAATAFVIVSLSLFFPLSPPSTTLYAPDKRINSSSFHLQLQIYPRKLKTSNGHNAGTEDSVDPSAEYNKTFRGCVGACTGVGGWNTYAGGYWPEGEVKDLVRAEG